VHLRCGSVVWRLSVKVEEVFGESELGCASLLVPCHRIPVFVYLEVAPDRRVRHWAGQVSHKKARLATVDGHGRIHGLMSGWVRFD
jgi:hypothetical protein